MIFKWVKFKGILLTIAILYIIMSVGYTVVKLSLLRHLQAACGILAFFCDPLWGCKDKEQKKIYIYTFRTLIKRIKLIKLSGLEFNVYCISDHSGGHAARVCRCVYTSLWRRTGSRGRSPCWEAEEEGPPVALWSAPRSLSCSSYTGTVLWPAPPTGREEHVRNKTSIITNHRLYYML